MLHLILRRPLFSRLTLILGHLGFPCNLGRVLKDIWQVNNGLRAVELEVRPMQLFAHYEGQNGQVRKAPVDLTRALIPRRVSCRPFNLTDGPPRAGNWRAVI